MKRPRVAHICTVDLSLRYLLLNQLLALRDAGYDVVGISAPGPDVPFLEAAGIPHIAVPLTRAFTPTEDLHALAVLTSVLRRGCFDIVHTHTPKPSLLGQLAARLVRTPVVINTVHGFYFHDAMRPRTRRFYVAMEKIAARQSHAILSQNPEDIETAVRERICRREQIEHLGNGIDLARFSRRALSVAHQAALRLELGIGAREPVVGFVGRLVEEKGILELFAAMQCVRARVPGARLLIVGPVDTVKEDALSPARARDFGLEDACVFTGMRQDMPELYGLMNVLALPSHREGFPRAPMEASAMGIPVVATDIRGCRETVLDGETGHLVPTSDPAALAGAIEGLLVDEARAQRFGARAEHLARERFDEQRVFAKVMATYERLLRSRGIAAPRAPLRAEEAPLRGVA